MIGIWKPALPIFLYVLGAASILTFGLPLLLVPMRWARFFRWEIPEQKQLASTLGRSLGAMLCVLSAFAFVAAGVPSVQPFYVNMLLAVFGINALLHIYGAIRKAQPLIETYEIGLWVLFVLITLAFYPT